MSVIYMKKCESSDESLYMTVKPARYRLVKTFYDWLNAQCVLRREWEKQHPYGRKVPYRVWARHGAYLEEHRNDH